MADDHQLGLELADAPASRAKFSGLGGADPWDLAAVEAVLLDPLRQCDGMNVEIVGRLLLRFARTDERDGLSAALGRVGTVFSLPVKAVT